MKYVVVTCGTSGIELDVSKMFLSKGYLYLQHTLVLTSQNRLKALEFKTNQIKREDVYAFVNLRKVKLIIWIVSICNAGISIRKSFTEYGDKN